MHNFYKPEPQRFIGNTYLPVYKNLVWIPSAGYMQVYDENMNLLKHITSKKIKWFTHLAVDKMGRVIACSCIGNTIYTTLKGKFIW